MMCLLETNSSTKVGSANIATMTRNSDGLVIRDKSGTAMDEDALVINRSKTQLQATEILYSTGNNGKSWDRLRPAMHGYLRMGWHSAQCLWRQYGRADTEQESLIARSRLVQFAWFWTVVIGVSVAFLWSTFGFSHELFCYYVVVPPVTYAKDVNQYLTMVPPHVVVTNKGKMFRYQPTIEERFLWESAKRIANFKI